MMNKHTYTIEINSTNMNQKPLSTIKSMVDDVIKNLFVSFFGFLVQRSRFSNPKRTILFLSRPLKHTIYSAKAKALKSSTFVYVPYRLSVARNKGISSSMTIRTTTLIKPIQIITWYVLFLLKC